MAGRRELRHYGVAEIERVAGEFLAKYWKPSDVWVDVETIIERDLGVLIDYPPFEAFPAVGSLARRVSDGRLVIIVSEELANRNPNRYRFTLAQEVSHLLLHQEVVDAIRSQEDVIEFQESLGPDDYKHMEGNANRCAAAILMPLPQFADAARASYAEWFRRLSQAGSSSAQFLEKHIVDDLAKLYQVSAQAARIRLGNWPVQLDHDIIEYFSRGLPFLP